MLSAVRLPTPPPPEAFPQEYNPRKRSPPSRSPSPVRRRSPPAFRSDGDSVSRDVDSQRATERERHLTERLRRRETNGATSKPPTEEQKQAAAKKEYDALLNARSGGTYVPPARLRALQASITDKKSKEVSV